MVKKLLRSELQYYFRSALIMYPVLIGIALIVRIIQFFEYDSFVFNIASGSSIMAFVVASIVVVTVTAILIVSRFYRNLYGQEGYLSFTLPVTENQHILAKLLGAMIVTVTSVLALVLAILVATAGEVSHELFKVVGYWFNQMFKYFGWHTVPQLILRVLAAVAYIALFYLFLYLCMTVGQLAKKRRKLLAVAFYFAVYFVEQFFMTLLVIIVGVNAERIQWALILEWINDHVVMFGYLFFGVVLLILCLLGLLFWTLTRFIMKKKLNLE